MYVLICVLYYLIGSVPTAFIYMKLKHASNIFEQGSGNSGAMNVFDVTKSKLDGIVVLLIDLLKGLIPALLLKHYWEGDPMLMILPLSLLVIGHNFPVWTKFKGGRGLATGAGVVLAFNPLIVAIWLVTYFVSRKIIDNVHIASSIALILLPVVVWIARFDAPYSRAFIFCLTLAISFAALLRHIVPVYNFLNPKLSNNK